MSKPISVGEVRRALELLNLAFKEADSMMDHLAPKCSCVDHELWVRAKAAALHALLERIRGRLAPLVVGRRERD